MPSPVLRSPAVLRMPSAVSRGWRLRTARLAAQLTAAEAALSQGRASPAVLTRQALIVQLTCLKLAVRSGWARRVISAVPRALRAAAAADIRATADLAPP